MSDFETYYSNLKKRILFKPSLWINFKHQYDRDNSNGKSLNEDIEKGLIQAIYELEIKEEDITRENVDIMSFSNPKNHDYNKMGFGRLVFESPHAKRPEIYVLKNTIEQNVTFDSRDGFDSKISLMRSGMVYQFPMSRKIRVAIIDKMKEIEEITKSKRKEREYNQDQEVIDCVKTAVSDTLTKNI